MRAVNLGIACLCLVIFILAGQWSYVLYLVATTGVYELTERNTAIITYELIIAAWITIVAGCLVILYLRRCRGDNRR